MSHQIIAGVLVFVISGILALFGRAVLEQLRAIHQLLEAKVIERLDNHEDRITTLERVKIRA